MQSQVTLQGNALGIQFSASRTRNSVGGGAWNPTLVAAILGTDWTKATSSTGTLVVPGGHGLTTGDLVDVFWPASPGVADGSVLGATATVTGNSIALAGGAGSTSAGAAAYPSTDHANAIGMTISKCSVLVCPFGATLNSLQVGIQGPRAAIAFYSVAPALLFSLDINSGEFYSWDINAGEGTSPLGGTACATAKLANSDPTNTSIVTLIAMYDS